MSDQAMISEDDIARAADMPPERVEAQPQPAARQEPPAPERQQETSDPASEPAQQRPPVMVPVGEVQAQRERRKKAEAELAARDREMAEMRGMLAALQQQSSRQTQPTQPQQPAAAPDLWTDPEGFTRSTSGAVVAEQLKPVLDFQQRTAQVLDYNNRLVAGQVHGSDAVKAAEEAFNTAAARGQIDPLEHQRINSSPNPYAAAVEWHKRNETLSKVGNDPDKWFQSTLEQRLQSDPEFQQRIFASLQGQAQAVEGSGQAKPVFASLPSVNGAAGASARGPSNLSEDDIYAAAPQKMGRR